ncbi:MAG: TIGR03111 family XrtG-associated glycosyltransferase [Clostridium sp.]
MERVWEEFLFWGVWLVIPIMVDIIGGIVAAVFLLYKWFKKKKELEMEFYPKVTIIIPIYNSEKSLEKCIESIKNSDYPIKNLQIFLIDNGSNDASKEIYYNLQQEYSNLRMWWLDSSQGKAKALNKGLYMADGKYIINIDSDGILEKNAIKNMVYKFENNIEISAMTGVIVTDFTEIKETKGLYKKLIQKCELFEYCEAFIVGRGFQSITNSMFTLAGAFSAFRKDVILKTQLYNGETLGEDTHMTSQIRDFLNGKVVLCEDAFFITEPVESTDKLYVQRQRWQRGEIEVSTLFDKKYSGSKMHKVMLMAVINDHTLLFPRLIWIFAMVYLMMMEYPMELIIGANILLYVSYILMSYIYFFVERLYLKEFRELKKYLTKNFYIPIFLPFYRMILFIVRAAGVINAVEAGGKWTTKNLTEEKQEVKEKLKDKLKWFYTLKSWINGGE